MQELENVSRRVYGGKLDNHFHSQLFKLHTRIRVHVQVYEKANIIKCATVFFLNVSLLFIFGTRSITKVDPINRLPSDQIMEVYGERCTLEIGHTIEFSPGDSRPWVLLLLNARFVFLYRVNNILK